ncbi:MAG: flavin reductase [Anaerolineaceae bacterium]|jgi:flavin reductase (DIM6/NTAB) family NADH-FMN oxidoreductase RutF|nr:flavin reductase [Chloroflexota bacterium]UCC51274.1 MAG: flavin reductase [Anaerolineaceae bacterium]
METSYEEQIIPLSLEHPVWDRVFTVAPLVVIGTREPDGAFDLAPKHLATPLSWKNHFGFVCTPRHATYQNIKREGVFTVSYPRPTQMVLTSLTAVPREDDGSKPALALLPTFQARQIEGVFIEDAYLYFECELDRIIDGFDINSLIASRIIAAYAAADSLRQSDMDDADLLADAPLLAYINWGRFARIQDSFSFPFVSGFKR